MTAKPVLHANPELALLPEARPVFADLAARGLTHRWAMSPRSSQTFALNLFAPLDSAGIGGLLGLVGMDAVGVDPVVFEYSDELDRMAEARPGSPHRTQVDVLVRGLSGDGKRLAALIEVKFTESDFGACSAYQNPANPGRAVCQSAGLFGGQPDGCFQLSNHGTGRRRYDQYLADLLVVQPTGASDDGGCLVRLGRNQPMRNLAWHISCWPRAKLTLSPTRCAPLPRTRRSGAGSPKSGLPFLTHPPGVSAPSRQNRWHSCNATEVQLSHDSTTWRN